jgi:hypothetical protein
MQFQYPITVEILGIMNRDNMIFFKLLYLRKDICYGIKAAIEAA